MSRESELYRENVPRELEQRMVYVAARSVLLAQAESRERPDFELDVVPTLRRIRFQSEQLDATYPTGTVVERREHNGGCHVVLYSGDVAITSLTRSKMPRSHKLQPYQGTLATEGQRYLFASEEAADERERRRLWGLFIYGGHYRSTKLTLCRMTFPTPKGAFAPGTIDLLAEHPDIINMFNDEEYARRQVIDFLETRKARTA